jgi:hypothetical protein
LLSLVGALLAVPPGAHPQTDARARVEENFRREPNGTVLARIPVGAPVRVLEREGAWSEVELSGSVWLRSLQASDDPAYDLVVSVEGGENLRSGPGGSIVARLVEGALLEEVGRDPAWAQVRRTGWIWSASLDEAAGAVAGPMIQPEAPAAGAGSPPSAGPASRRPGGFVGLGGSSAPILTAPSGDTLAIARPRTDVEVLGREGSWVRVRLEGWMWIPVQQGPQEGAEPVADTTPSALEPVDLSADPAAHVGRVVTWSVQFISVERAEAVRTDFFEGEPFLLTRFGGTEGPFVYVAVPPDRLVEVEGLVPLERIAITGRIRTGASVLTGTPIVDLLSLERSREDR